MICWLCPKPDAPSGGCWFIHRLAHMLNDLGVASFVHQVEPFDVWWDAHPVPSQAIASEPPRSSDTVIVPEVMWPLPAVYARQILFIQNRQWLVKELDYQDSEVLVCSRYLANWVERTYRVKPLGKITPFLDDDVWNPTPKQSNRTLVIARRNPYHAQMRDLLEASGFPVEYVTEALTQRQMAAKLADCEFYIHLNHPEGFPMACLEAMRMGTIVVGTTGQGGNEFMFHRETALVVQDPETGRYPVQEYLSAILEQMVLLRGDADLRSKMWQQAYAWSQRYTAEATRAELSAVFPP